MTTENKYRIGFFILLIISSLFFFDFIRIDMEDETLEFPTFISGVPAEMPSIVERLESVEQAVCSSSKEGEKAVRKHAIGMLKKKAGALGGNGVVDIVTDYGQHSSLKDDCSFGVYVRGTAVVFAD
ncbi:MAG: hypothetical protein COB22_00775 [Cycloclasticus sp.]|nr:MAG: hypothetical protein COB22_00775 [Cycloclasticus sp.]